MDAITAGLGADIYYRVADASGGGEEDAVGGGDADGHGVDQRIAIIGRVEVDLTADGRDADAVAVAANAAHDAIHQPLRHRVVRSAEAQRVKVCNRSGTHGEHVTQDATDAGRRALIRLDEARVIVRLHLENRGQAFA